MSTNINERPKSSHRVADQNDLPFLVALQKKHSNELGFLPRAAMEVYVARGNVRVSEENGDPAGYILARERLRYAPEISPITQTAVCIDARNHAHARTIVDQFALDAINRGQSIQQCWCAEDIPAMAFWRAMGFTALVRAKPDNQRGRSLVLFRRALTEHLPPTFYMLPLYRGYRSAKLERSTIEPIHHAMHESCLLPEKRLCRPYGFQYELWGNGRPIEIDNQPGTTELRDIRTAAATDN